MGVHRRNVGRSAAADHPGRRIVEAGLLQAESCPRSDAFGKSSKTGRIRDATEQIAVVFVVVFVGMCVCVRVFYFRDAIWNFAGASVTVLFYYIFYLGKCAVF